MGRVYAGSVATEVVDHFSGRYWSHEDVIGVPMSEHRATGPLCRSKRAVAVVIDVLLPDPTSRDDLVVQAEAFEELKRTERLVSWHKMRYRLEYSAAANVHFSRT
jgi:hypothetical protein